MPSISRRSFFLASASAAAFLRGKPTVAGIAGGFNNGKSQIQFWDLGYSGDYPFINLMKCASKWTYRDNQGEPAPNELDADGYPIKLFHGGVKCITRIFPPSVRNGTYVLTWTGNGTLFVGVPNSGTVVPASGFTNANLTSRSGAGRFEFTTSSPDGLVVGISALEQQHITNVNLYYKEDEPAFKRGQVFGDRFLSVLHNGNPGVIRFLDWANANTTNVTTWLMRKPITYYSYSTTEYRPALYAGVTKSRGIKYSATLDGAHVADKATIHVTFSDNPVSVSIGPIAAVTWVNHGMAVGMPFMFLAPPGASLPAPIRPSSYNGQHNLYWVTSILTSDAFTFSATKGGPDIDTSGGKLIGTPTAFATTISQNVSLSNANPAIVTWSNHGLSIGDAVSINSVQSFGLPAPLLANQTYYVIAQGFTRDSFHFSLTRDGAAVNTAGARQSGQIQAFAVPTISLNGSGGLPILSPWGDPHPQNGVPFGGRLTSTLVYDNDLKGWLKFGGDVEGSTGVANGVPPEIMVTLCAEVGAQPHFCAPYLACDPMTDWHTQLASYVKAKGPTWMRPRFEAPNECWNFGYGFYATRYAWNKSAIHWGPSYVLSHNDWYGKVVSTIGQAINGVYGGIPGTQTRYAIICAIQTVTAGNHSNDPRLTAAAYVAQRAPPQAGYLKSAAYNWVTHSSIANYWNPGERDTATEVTHAYRYAVTSAGNRGAKAVIAAAYIETATIDTAIAGSPAHAFNLASVRRYAVLCRSWAMEISGGLVNKMCAYEGGYSPDYPKRDSDFNSAITAISQSEQAVVTLGTFNGSGLVGKGNPAIVGMPVVIVGVRGGAEFNTRDGAGVTILTGTPARVGFAGHRLGPGQPIFFRPQNPIGSQFPTGLIFGKVYYVRSVIDANTFTVSTSRGGSPIEVTTSQIQGVVCVPCLEVLAASGNDITLDVDSSKFDRANGGQVIWGGTHYNVIQLRQAAKFAPVLETYARQLYTDFVSAGGEFPSCYFLSGKGAVWSVWDPDIYTISPPPQWRAIAAFNHE